MKKVNFKIEEQKLIVGFDNDTDGTSSVALEVDLNEAIQEAFKKGEAISGVKAVTVKFEGSTLVVKADSDKDGETLLDLKLDLFEIIKESGLLK